MNYEKVYKLQAEIRQIEKKIECARFLSPKCGDIKTKEWIRSVLLRLQKNLLRAKGELERAKSGSL